MSIALSDWSPPQPTEEADVGDGLRWGVAGAVALAIHLVALWIQLRDPPTEVITQPPAAIMIELAPMAVAPPSQIDNVAPGPQMEAAPEPVPDAPDKPDDPPPPTPETTVQTLEKIPDLPPPPPLVKAEVSLPKAAEKPPEKKQVVHNDKPTKPKPDQKGSRKPAAPMTSAAPHSEAPPADKLAAPSPGVSTAPSQERATWLSMLVAQLRRSQRYPEEARMRNEHGVAMVNLAMDRSGNVLSVRLLSSSGSATLDEEAQAVIRRCSPLPAPPAEIPGAPVKISLPVRFNQS